MSLSESISKDMESSTPQDQTTNDGIGMQESESDLISTAQEQETGTAQDEVGTTRVLVDAAEMAELRKKIESILSNQSRARRESPSFTLFPAFPLEIRRHVWKHALTGPHIHVITSRAATCSRITVIMQSCKEAYEEGLQLQFSHFTYCDYSSWGGANFHAVLPKHYMNPDADIMWVVQNKAGSILPCSLSLYDGRAPYRMVKILAIDYRVWTEPSVGRGNKWNPGSIDLVPFQMCEEIYIVLNEVAFSLFYSVDFVEPEDVHHEPFSSYWLTSQGYEKSGSVHFREAKERRKVWEGFREYCNNLEEGEVSSLMRPQDAPPIRYVIAKSAHDEASFKCFKNRKPITAGRNALTPLNKKLMPDELRVLTSDWDFSCDHPINCVPQADSDDDGYDEFEGGLEFDSNAEDVDVDESDTGTNTEPEDENL
ncbi:hypothetical protein OCU04_001336 [Sclerotinia nivalis]|uniref:2EXR domain-containing protein n=1 Tax=Sclerotinia nivalis TaxID=352851 RepID=A0A9X0DPM2_9HELO|nr:hypothetical protein OCU04_001336 [Sclerotinia nivalis]